MEKEKDYYIPYLDGTNIGVLYFYQIKEKESNIKKQEYINIYFCYLFTIIVQIE